MRYLRARCVYAPLCVLALMFMLASWSRADTVILTFVGSAPAGGGLTAFNYTVQLAALPPAVAGLSQGVAGEYDHATVFDFAGFAGFGAVPAGWAPAAPPAPLLGPAAYAQTPPDSPALPNPTIDYVGAPVVSPVLFPGVLTLLSKYHGGTKGVYSSEDVENVGFGFERSGHTAGTIVAVVPTPSTVLGGMALMAMAVVPSLRRRFDTNV